MTSQRGRSYVVAFCSNSIGIQHNTRSQPEAARSETETILRLVRGVPPGAESNFNLSTADQIIAQFDRIGAQIFLATVALWHRG